MNTDKHHRFPPDINSYAVWLYFRFNLSHRDIEDLLAERGVIVGGEALLQAFDEEPWWRTSEDTWSGRSIIETSG